MKLLWGSPVSAGARVSVARPEGPQVAHHPPPTTGSSSPPVPPLTFEVRLCRVESAGPVPLPWGPACIC